MGFHTYPVERADALEDPSRYRYLSAEELVALLDPAPDDVVADLGSGTGFYTDDVAAAAGTVLAVDLQAAMHARYREKGVPDNVAPVVAAVTPLPVADGALDGVVSTMTYHEFASPAALADVARALRPGARFVVADWTANGTGADGPPLDERYALADAVEALSDAGFAVEHADERRETFVVAAVREGGGRTGE